MNPAAHDAMDEEELLPAPLTSSVDEPRPDERHNFLTLVVYNVLMRTGWIFKTESSIMPAVLDSFELLGTPRWALAWMRGALPLLNRFGQSVPPLMMSRRIKIMPKKKWAFVATTTSMTLIFAILTAIWLVPGLIKPHTGVITWLIPLLYLVLYAAFFMAVGVNQLTYNTIQGKLIRVSHRGRLLMIADSIGAMSAVVCALTLLPQWLREDNADFHWIFGFSTALFGFSSITAWLLHEQPDSHEQPPQPFLQPFVTAWRTLREDSNFCRLGIVAALFSTSLVLFPHYQALAREQLHLGFDYLVWWVVAQNIGTGIFSILTGPLADRFGNRLSLRILTLLIAAAPQLALILVQFSGTGGFAFSMVFLLVGMTPVAQKTFNNYTLEIARPADHPRYLSTLNLCMAMPIFLSPIVGGLIGLVGFHPVYHGITALLLAGAFLSTTLQEPREPLKTLVTPGDESL
ncbi:MAG: MFS transporter [Planctomycetales bacterium]|nr:MFS transporter [Planctomycetales bacterium]